MQSHTWRGVSIRWKGPRGSDLTVAAALYYLLDQHPQVPWFIAAAVAVTALRCIRLTPVT
ncbi:hypothetical protein ACIQXD_29665 [Streptomyces uncialis]|uniref:hypothetical protein n=1 Tax=Streptomyces uncialis TaxID=1048205 RepID=UPI0038272EEC